jgi:hypothetical protein
MGAEREDFTRCADSGQESAVSPKIRTPTDQKPLPAGSGLIHRGDLLLSTFVVLTAASATNCLLLGDPTFFGFGNEPAFAADVAENTRAGDGFPETPE